jgi:peptidoglycan/LPS O-acetylase OafA/YrhL
VSWGYRPALDGARTLAVYLVVLFHAGLPWMDGGFIGVDLFFVLSGFLVSTILYAELSGSGHLDLVRFYDRRVRRLLPAAVVLVVVVSLTGVLVLSAAERGPMAGDARAALLYYANWHFMAQSNDYFGSTVVDSSLFLHFWSLSIEEQFYFLFPVLLLVLHRVDRQWRHASPVVLGLLLAVSVGLQRWWAPQDANHAYYGTETRFYQLLAGVLLALWLHRRRAAGREVPGAVPATAVGTVVLVALASSWLDLSPSWRGIVATLGALLLVGGLSGERVHAAARPFTLPPVVYLGKISYGTYLWHWPVVVLLGQAIDPPAWQLALLVTGLSTALAAASYTMLETPIRSRRLAPRWRLPAVLTGLAASLVTALLVVPPVMASTQPVALTGNGLLKDGPHNVTGPPPKLDYARLTGYREAPVRDCPPSALGPCRLVTGQDGPHVFVLGDSQAREMEPTLRMLAREKHFDLTMLSLDACSWVPGIFNLVSPVSSRQRCESLRSGFWDQVVGQERIDLLLLIQQDRSAPLFDGTLTDSLEGDPVPDTGRFLVQRTDAALARLDRLGVPTVVERSLWLPPEDANPMACLSGAEDVAQCRVPVARTSSALDSAYLVNAETRRHVHEVDLNPIFCPNAPVCDAVVDGIPVWRDSRHVYAKLQEAKREQIWHAIVATGVLDG